MNRKIEHQRDRDTARRIATKRIGILASPMYLECLYLNLLDAIRIGRKRGPIPRVIIPRFTKKKLRTPQKDAT